MCNPKTVNEVIAKLGGLVAAARFFDVKPPSVSGWQESGAIPEDRLCRYAARLEVQTDKWFLRTSQWPDTYGLYWPELIDKNASVVQASIAQAATENVAP